MENLDGQVSIVYVYRLKLSFEQSALSVALEKNAYVRNRVHSLLEVGSDVEWNSGGKKKHEHFLYRTLDIGQSTKSLKVFQLLQSARWFSLMNGIQFYLVQLDLSFFRRIAYAIHHIRTGPANDGSL